ncbi:MAG: clostripain-related cysteine peptidase [bacterium]
MRKMFFVALFVMSYVSVEASKTTMLFSKGHNYQNINQTNPFVVKGTKGPIDTLQPDLLPPFDCWGKDDRQEYEATMFTPVKSCSIMAIIHGVMSDTAASKPCSLFIWDDAPSDIGPRLFSMETMATATDSGISLNIFPLSSPIYVTGPFWVGNYEWDTLMPTTAFDTINSLPSAYNNDGDWYSENVDYFHGVIVKYDTVTIHKKWTILVYMNGDNGSEYNATIDVNKLEAGMDTSKYTVVVQYDRNPGFDTSNGNWTSARRYLITPDLNPGMTIRSELKSDLGEINMGDPNSLVDFVRWGVQNYPADNYALIMWGPADGWYKGAKKSSIKGTSYDETDGSYIGVASGEYGRAMDSVKTILGKNLDILANDASYMGMQEVAYEVKNNVDFFVASEYSIPQDDYPYDEILDSLNANYSVTPEEFANIMVDKYTNYYNGTENVTLSSVLLNNKFVHLSACVDTFAVKLMQAGGRTNGDIDNARYYTEEYFESPNAHIDLYDFAAHIKGKSGLSSSVRNWADSVMNAVNSAVIRKGSVGFDSSHGMAIYYPYDVDDLDTAYMQLSFTQDFPNWWDFINGDTLGISDNPKIPYTLTLLSPMPNPVSSYTNVRYTLPNKTNISLQLFDLTGRLVKTFYSGEQVAGNHTLKLQSVGLSKGIYFVTLKTGTLTKTQKLTILR